MSNERHGNLNLAPPEEGFELYRHQNAEQMTTRGRSGLYWARKSEDRRLRDPGRDQGG
jgi:hypothetical protein